MHHHVRHINTIQPEIDALWSSRIQMMGWRAFQPLNDAPSGFNAFQAACRRSHSEHLRRCPMLGRPSGQRLFTGVVTFTYHNAQCLQHSVHFFKKKKRKKRSLSARLSNVLLFLSIHAALRLKRLFHWQTWGCILL